MKLLYVILTAVVISTDSFVAGFSLSLNAKKTLLLPISVALVTLLLCLVTSFAGHILADFLNRQTVKFLSVGILLCLGFTCLFENDSAVPSRLGLSQCLATGFVVGLDGAAANLSLVLQGGNPLALPLLFAATHFAAVFLGQRLAKGTKPQRAGIFSAVTFFVLAAIKLFGQ